MPFSMARRSGPVERWSRGGGRPFRDRADAGRQLAERLLHLGDQRPIVLALPRGGVPVGAEVARALGAPLDVFLVRKIGTPGHRELGIGAVAQGDVRIFNEAAIEALDLPRPAIDAIVREETAELERRLHRFRGDRPMPDLRDRTAILVDDGLATGVTALAAIRALRQLGPARTVLAVPVCPKETAETMRGEVDEFICLLAPDDFYAVGLWYGDFDQTTDEEVVNLLAAGRLPPAVEGDSSAPWDAEARTRRRSSGMADNMIDARTIKGLGVVSIESGAKLGSVDDVLFDTKGLRAAALHIKSDRQQAVIPYSDVASVGENAVTVPGDLAARWGASGGELASLPTLNDIKKLKVVDEAGTLLGTIDDVCIDPADGRIAELKVHKGGVLGVGGESHRIPASVITSVGDEVIIVPVPRTAP